MATPIKYSNVYLYNRINEASRQFRIFLDTNNVQYTNMQYRDGPEAASNLVALNSWFSGRAPFTDMPVLVFEKVLWESPEDGEVFQKRECAGSPDELPADWLIKVDKLTLT